MAIILKELCKINQNIKFILHLKPKFYTQSVLSKSDKFIENCSNYIQFSKEWTSVHVDKANNLLNDVIIHPNFLTEEDEQCLFDELEPYLKRLRYEFDHWDDAIHGYRETERLNWNENNTKIINRVREVAFSKTVEQLSQVHVLDLAPNGYIKPHIDAVRFCGNTIAGLCLLSDCIMRFVHDQEKTLSTDVLLNRRSLYIIKDTARYDYTHEVLANEVSYFQGKQILKDRRISVICRNEPT